MFVFEFGSQINICDFNRQNICSVRIQTKIMDSAKERFILIGQFLQFIHLCSLMYFVFVGKAAGAIKFVIPSHSDLSTKIELGVVVVYGK